MGSWAGSRAGYGGDGAVFYGWAVGAGTGWMPAPSVLAQGRRVVLLEGAPSVLGQGMVLGDLAGQGMGAVQGERWHGAGSELFECRRW